MKGTLPRPGRRPRHSSPSFFHSRSRSAWSEARELPATATAVAAGATRPRQAASGDQPMRRRQSKVHGRARGGASRLRRVGCAASALQTRRTAEVTTCKAGTLLGEVTTCRLGRYLEREAHTRSASFSPCCGCGCSSRIDAAADGAVLPLPLTRGRGGGGEAGAAGGIEASDCRAFSTALLSTALLGAARSEPSEATADDPNFWM